MKRPASQFYWGDWLRDVALRSLSPAARGLWIDLLCVMHQGDPYGHLALNGRALTEAEIAKITGLDPRTYRRLLAEVEARGVSSRTGDGILYSRRMVKDEEIRSARAAGGVQSLKHPNVPRPAVQPDLRDISDESSADLRGISEGSARSLPDLKTGTSSGSPAGVETPTPSPTTSTPNGKDTHRGTPQGGDTVPSPSVASSSSSSSSREKATAKEQQRARARALAEPAAAMLRIQLPPAAVQPFDRMLDAVADAEVFVAAVEQLGADVPGSTVAHAGMAIRDLWHAGKFRPTLRQLRAFTAGAMYPLRTGNGHHRPTPQGLSRQERAVEATRRFIEEG